MAFSKKSSGSFGKTPSSPSMMQNPFAYDSENLMPKEFKREPSPNNNKPQTPQQQMSRSNSYSVEDNQIYTYSPQLHFPTTPTLKSNATTSFRTSQEVPPISPSLVNRRGSQDASPKLPPDNDKDQIIEVLRVQINYLKGALDTEKQKVANLTSQLSNNDSGFTLKSNGSGSWGSKSATSTSNTTTTTTTTNNHTPFSTPTTQKHFLTSVARQAGDETVEHLLHENSRLKAQMEDQSRKLLDSEELLHTTIRKLADQKMAAENQQEESQNNIMELTELRIQNQELAQKSAIYEAQENAWKEMISALTKQVEELGGKLADLQERQN